MAQPIWPATDAAWVPLPCPLNPLVNYRDPHDDFPGAPGLHCVDIVGDATYTAGFAASDGTYLMLRMRLDCTAEGEQYVWQFLFDLDGDTDVDYSLQRDQKVDDSVEFIPATSGGPLFYGVALQPHTNMDPHWHAALPTLLTRIIAPTDDGANLGDVGGGDAFLDVSIPWTEFTSRTGEAQWDGSAPFPWTLYLTSSSSHIRVNKDVPTECGLSADQVPEPASLTLLALGACSLLAARRRRRAR